MSRQPHHQYLISVYGEENYSERDLMHFVKFFNEQYDLNIDIELHEMTPVINEKFSAIGTRTIYSTKEKK